MSPLLSVIVPVYNACKYLDACVQSVLNQSFRDFDLFLVDDGSTDGSSDLCDRFAASDARIRVIHQPNGGVSRARNAALDRVQGKYLVLMDADDVIAPDTYGPNIGILERHPEVDFVQFPLVERWGAPDVFERRVDRPMLVEGGKEIFRSWQRSGVITGYVLNKIFRRALFEKLRFVEGMIFEDRYLETDLFPSCRAAYVSPAGGYYYRYAPGSLTHSGKSGFYWKSVLKADRHLTAAMLRIGGVLPQLLRKLPRLCYYRLQVILSNIKK